MKVLLVNKFYYPRGGDCVVVLATERLLRECGHEVRIFTMQHPDNLPLPTENEGWEVQSVNFAGSVADKVKGIGRIFGLGSIASDFQRALDTFRPDVVHLHNIHSYLSPVVAKLAHQRGIRVVWTLHDYKLICPSYSCRLTSGENCEACIGAKPQAARHRCLKGSLLHSALADAEAWFWNPRRLQKYTDRFIAPSDFMANKIQEGGFSKEKICVITNFLDPAKMEKLKSERQPAREPYFCYIGRLSEEKGVETMLKAAAESGVTLKVAGSGPLAETLTKRFENYPNIEFLGHLNSEQVTLLLIKACASILPSECYENNPLGIIESLCAGTPVIGARIGGIPELISPKNGVTFTSGNAEELTEILRNWAMLRNFDHDKISQEALQRFNRDTHYAKLMEAYGHRP